MIDYRIVIDRFGIEPRGVLHVGAFDGAENNSYTSLGFRNRLFVEAQPDTFARLSQQLQGSGAYCENYAASNANGTAAFHITNNGQSSSLMSLCKHLDVYPDIKEISVVEVETIRIDDLLAKPEYSGLDFNFLNLDIQGAEMLALSGACERLPQFDILNLEVNFDRLYDKAPHISELDAFLSAFQFIRADTFLFHKSWGDAIYVKNKYTKA